MDPDRFQLMDGVLAIKNGSASDAVNLDEGEVVGLSYLRIFDPPPPLEKCAKIEMCKNKKCAKIRSVQK